MNRWDDQGNYLSPPCEVLPEAETHNEPRPATPARTGYVQVGILVDRVEFIPQDIVQRHTPFVATGAATVEAVFVESPGGAA